MFVQCSLEWLHRYQTELCRRSGWTTVMSIVLLWCLYAFDDAVGGGFGRTAVRWI
jgi:hypothetical protein